MTFNLNKALIPAERGFGVGLADYGTSSGSVEVVFRDIENRLIREIDRSDVVFGCVAWLTNKRILQALARVQCCIIVQKEDFLRPDTGSKGLRLKSLYGAIRNSFGRFQLWHPLGETSYGKAPDLDGVRCVGNHNASRAPAFPRSHHKFVVFGHRREDPREGSSIETYGRVEWAPIDQTFSFDRVWTGSFNFTQNAGHSLENALIVSDTRVTRAYLGEFAQVAALSEPLDWESEWCAPEWRLGT